MKKIFAGMALTVLTSLSASPVLAIGPSSASFADNAIHASFNLTNGLNVTLDVTFENTVGLNARNIVLDAEIVSPLDASIINRLPNNVTIPTGFPVVISIEPDPNSGFAFEGMATVELYTKAIGFDEKLRIFKSHKQQTFEDITMLTSEGSIRSRGNGGKFSQFMILMDDRDSVDIVAEKINRIETLLQNNSSGLESAINGTVATIFSAISSLTDSGDYSAALTKVDALIRIVDAANGNLIDDVWMASDNVVNVKGELLSALHSLRFTLRTF